MLFNLILASSTKVMYIQGNLRTDSRNDIGKFFFPLKILLKQGSYNQYVSSRIRQLFCNNRIFYASTNNQQTIKVFPYTRNHVGGDIFLSTRASFQIHKPHTK